MITANQRKYLAPNEDQPKCPENKNSKFIVIDAVSKQKTKEKN